MANAPETFAFQAEVSEVLDLVIHSLYSHREIFVRELISNASDALDKLRFRALTEHDLVPEGTPREIRVIPDEEAGTITFEDFGVGMTREELISELGTIARSGTRAFVARAKQATSGEDGGAPPELIGQFGVGFYSAWLVADRVEVVSRAAGHEDAWRWSSDAKEGFTVEPAERESVGTAITLHLRDDAKEYLSDWKLRQLIGQYSDFVNHPIMLQVQRMEPADPDAATDGDGDGEDPPPPKVTTALEQVNKATALWRRPKAEVTDEEYAEFYKHLNHDWEAPLTHIHFQVEGTQSFTGLLYVPARPPMDLFSTHHRRGVRLYVKRVFIMDDAEELVPQWLRFIRGLIDSDDLPLNVSRELLQDSAVVRRITKQVVRKSLEMFEQLAKDEEAYAKFWEAFGAVLKEGLHFATDQADRLSKLVRYHSSASEDTWTSLSDYVSRMPEGQEAIYYVIAPSQRAAATSPYLEAVKARGYEVLFMTDPVDEWVVKGGLTTFDDKPLVSVASSDFKLDAKTDEDAERDGEEGSDTSDAGDDAPIQALLKRFQEVLGDRVAEVRTSERLTDSPVCLVIPPGGLHAHWERILKQTDATFQATRRILELNPKHPVIQTLAQRLASQTDAAGEDAEGSGEGKDGVLQVDDELRGWMELLYDQALLTEGSPIEDPNAFARRMTSLLQSAMG